MEDTQEQRSMDKTKICHIIHTDLKYFQDLRFDIDGPPHTSHLATVVSVAVTIATASTPVVMAMMIVTMMVTMIVSTMRVAASVATHPVSDSAIQ